MTREMEMARKLYETCLDMDYMDNADCVSEELEILESEIKQVREQFPSLGYLLESLADLQTDETPLIDRMLAYNEQ